MLYVDTDMHGKLVLFDQLVQYRVIYAHAKHCVLTFQPKMRRVNRSKDILGEMIFGTLPLSHFEIITKLHFLADNESLMTKIFNLKDGIAGSRISGQVPLQVVALFAANERMKKKDEKEC
jgi:hypothetical protein